MYAVFRDKDSLNDPGYILAKVSVDGDLKWNVWHRQGYDVNITSNAFRMPRVKVAPDESFVAFRARLRA